MKRQVVVVGAGPGGSAAAFYLAKAGVDVLLVDKETWPRNKTCGDVYLPSLTPMFNEMGIMDEMMKELASQPNTIKFVSPDEEVALFSCDPMYLIPRRIGDDIIRRGAVRGGAEFKENFEALELIIKRGVVKGIKGLYNNQEVIVEADAVVIADGSHSRLSRQLGLLREDDPEMYLYAARGYYDNVENMVPNQAVEFYIPSSLPNYSHCANYIWVTPLYDGKKASVGITMNEKTLREIDMTFDEVFEFWATKTKEGPKYMKNATVIKPLTGWRLPFSKTLGKCCVPGAVVIGDAASMAESASQYGVTPAMFAGQIVGQMLPNILEKGEFLEEEALEIQQVLEKRLNPEYQFSAMMKDLLMNDPIHLKNFIEYSKKMPNYPNNNYGYSVMSYFKDELGIEVEVSEDSISQ